MEVSESLLNYFIIPAVKAVVVVILVATVAGILTYIERRTLAFLQVRKGPNRVGPQGVLQWVADVVKLLTKEDVVPAKAQHFVHFLAPVLVMVPGMAVFAVLPWGPEFTMRIPGLGKITTAWYAADLNVSLLLVLAIAAGVAVDRDDVRAPFTATVESVLSEATLVWPAEAPPPEPGTEDLFTAIKYESALP